MTTFIETIAIAALTFFGVIIACGLAANIWSTV